MYYETLTDLLNNDPAAYEYFYALPPEMQTAMRSPGSMVCGCAPWSRDTSLRRA